MKARLLINGNETEYPDFVSNLEELLIFVMENKKSGDEIIGDVKVDGDLFSETYSHQAQEIPVDQGGKIEIDVITEKIFAQRFMDVAPSYLDNLKTGFGQAAALLKSKEKEEDGHDILGRSFKAMHAFKAHLDNVVTVLKKESQSALSEDMLALFDQTTSKILAAQESKDAAAIAALLETDMLPFIDQWKKLLG
jgi:hypothetical protein